MELETKRLILRRPQAADVQDYLEFCNTEFVLRYNVMTLKDREKAEKYISDCRDEILVLQHKQSGKVIGEVYVGEDSIRFGVASKELSYMIREDYSRQGYMKEALHAVIDHLFNREKVECVSARCFAPNEASLALLRSLGFRQDGYIPRCVKGYKDQIFDDTLHSLFCKDFV